MWRKIRLTITFCIFAAWLVSITFLLHYGIRYFWARYMVSRVSSFNLKMIYFSWAEASVLHIQSYWAFTSMILSILLIVMLILNRRLRNL